MLRRFVGLFIVMLGTGAASLSAANVSVMLIETGPGAHGGGLSASEWESGMMDVFFDAGHIVSNARSLVLPEPRSQVPVSAGTGTDATLPAEAVDAFREAVEGGVDYFIIVTLHYADNGKAGTTAPRAQTRPDTVSVQLFGMAGTEFIYGDNYVWSDRAAPRPAYFNAQRAMRLVIPYMGDTL
jgi:hypothetical protein